MSKKIVLWLLLTLIISISHAQHITIQGPVTDSITNEKLPYTSLMVRGTTLGTNGIRATIVLSF